MTNPTSSNPVGVLKITLAASGRSRTFTGAELARLLDSPGIVVRLAAVLYSRPGRQAAGKRTTGREENAAQEQRSFRWNDGARDQSISEREQAVERTASYLADKLGDPKSIAFFRRIAEVLPAEVIRDALVKALDLRPANVRRSRAAYFTSLIMPDLRRCDPKP
jgi:hypothetical protein